LIDFAFALGLISNQWEMNCEIMLKEAGDRLLAEGDRVSQCNLIQEYMPVGNVNY